MFILELINNPLAFIGFIIILLVAITVHEAAHAWVADKLGDPTAKYEGRISLNPLDHLDTWGTIFFLLAGFGWGKPVPVNPNYFKNPRLDELIVSLAGPLSNLLLAVAAALILKLAPTGLLSLLLIIFIERNLLLMIFNLLPIPPLDGSHILGLFISESAYYSLQQMGFFILIILLFFTPYINNLVTAGVGFFLNILL